MAGPFDNRNALIGLVDEFTRLNGRLRTAFTNAAVNGGLSDSEAMVLNAVVEAKRPPTVPQIGRSLGQPRQTVQRATKLLLARGLIETLANPDHARAALLSPTDEGITLKRAADARADAIAEPLLEAIDREDIRAATLLIRRIRKELEAKVRQEGE